MENILRSNPFHELSLKVNGEMLSDVEIFKEVLRFGRSFLRKEVFELMTKDIVYSTGKVDIIRANPKFIVLYDMWVNTEGLKNNPLTTYQCYNNQKIFFGKHLVEAGIYLNGVSINKGDATHLINQFKSFKKSLGEIDSFGKLKIPLKIDLPGLELTKEGLFDLTERSIWSEDYSAKWRYYGDIDEYGVPTQGNGDHKISLMHPSNSINGAFRCQIVTNLVYICSNQLLLGINNYSRIFVKKE